MSKAVSSILTAIILIFAGCADKDQQKFSYDQESAGNTKTVSLKTQQDIKVNKDDDIYKRELNELLDVFHQRFIVQVTGTGSGYDSLVDYDSLHALRVRKDLNFLKLIATIKDKISTQDIEKLNRDEQVAFYINSYNFLAINLINNNYYIKGKIVQSIKELSAGLNPFEIFKRKIHHVAGEKLSFDDIEKVKVKGLLTNGSKVDARFHFAVICVSTGCPVTLNKAYRGDRLDQQLDFVTTEGLKLDRMLRVEGKTRFQTQLFDWYKDDFEKDAGSVEDFIKKFSTRTNLGEKIEFIDYDWSLNRLMTRRPVPTIPSFGNDSGLGSLSINCPQITLKRRTYKAFSYCTKVLEAKTNLGKVINKNTNACLYENPNDKEEAYIALNLETEIENKDGDKVITTNVLSDKLKVKEEKDNIISYKKGVFTKIKVVFDKESKTLGYIRKAGFSKKKTIVSFECQ